MIKITLFDENLCSVVSGTVSFFVDDDGLDEFEACWLNHPEIPYDKKDRYERSKAGELVSDDYTTSEKNNIFQCDSEAKILGQETFLLNDTMFKLHNFYDYASIIWAKEAGLIYRKIMYKGQYYLVGQYRLNGVCIEENAGKDYWRYCTNCGNKILKRMQPSEAYLRTLTKSRRKKCSREIFVNDSIETCCWIVLGCYDKESDIPFDMKDLLSTQVTDWLMCDIVGEAG